MIAAAAWPSSSRTTSPPKTSEQPSASPRPAVNASLTNNPHISAKIIKESQARAVCTAPRAGCGRNREHVATIELFKHSRRQDRDPRPSRAPALRMYCCGPTVYDYGQHRQLPHLPPRRHPPPRSPSQGVPLNHVMNITDVDDKIIRNAAAAGVPIRRTPRSTRRFLRGPRRPQHRTPRVLLPRYRLYSGDGCADRKTRRTRHCLSDRGWLLYFRIARFPEYGKLSKKDFDGIEDGARVDVDEYEKGRRARLRSLEGRETR